VISEPLLHFWEIPCFKHLLTVLVYKQMHNILLAKITRFTVLMIYLAQTWISFAGRSYPIELLQLCNHGVSFIKCPCHLDPCLYNTFLYCFLQEHHIQTKHGPVSVAVYGDHDKHALITYPDIALNRKFYY
jgi:hypothetical protein